MIYSEACEAQGMTLADLLSKQNGDYSIYDAWPKGKEVDTEYLDNIIMGRKDKILQAVVNNPLIINNFEGTDYVVEVYYNGGSKGRVTIGAGSTLELSYKSGYIIATTSGIPLIEFIKVAYYNSFGLSHVVLPSSASTYLPAIWDRVCTRVNERYWKRYLAAETLEEWQVLLQTMTDELAPRYERAFRMYAANSEASEADILATMRTDYGDGLTDEHTQTAKGTSKTTVRDTPDGQINDTSNYAGTVTDGVTDAGTTKSTRKGTVTVTQTGSDGVLGRVNENIRLWRDLETDLVKEYANAFMSFIWA